MTHSMLLLCLLAACGGGAYEITVAYPPASGCTTMLATRTSVGYGGKPGGRNHGDTQLELVELATHTRVAAANLGRGSILGVSKLGLFWLQRDGEIEARNACSGAVIATVSAIRARHPEAGRSILQIAYDPDGDALRLMNERAEGFMISSATLDLVPAPLWSYHEPKDPAMNWPGEGEPETWGLWGVPQRLTRAADILVAMKTNGPAKPASPLEMFNGEILHDDTANAVVDGPQSMLVSYHRDLLDKRLFVSRVARTGEVLWTRNAESFATPGRGELPMQFRSVHVAPKLGLVFAVVRTELVAFDPATGDVRWRLELAE